MLMQVLLILTLTGDVVLPGSNVSVRQAKERSDIIVVAEFVEAGSAIGIGAITVHISVKLKTSKVLKGNAPDGELTGLTMGASGEESEPMKGKNYLFFIETSGKARGITKVMPDTKENREAVRNEGD